MALSSKQASEYLGRREEEGAILALLKVMGFCICGEQAGQEMESSHTLVARWIVLVFCKIR